jgi:NAD(P)-dependent dehydrogenase (short-subunit alcohol dehydrogenase family)
MAEKEAEMKGAPRKKHGLVVNPDPLAETRAKGPKPAQQQPWPGHEAGMRPTADHGEESYKGSGKLLGRKALITGGDSGIGRAIAIAFAREGADVAIAYFNEYDDAQETLRWVRDAGREGLAIQGDLSNPAHCKEVVAQVVEEFGALDILVNNAGRHTEQTDLASISPEQLETTFRTNFFSAVWLTQAALSQMQEGGVILNTGSVTGLVGHPSLVDYAATKAAIHNFTKSLAQQVASRGIRVNCVAPGPVWTPLIVSTRPPERVASFGKDTLWHRPAQPAELAPSYVFLASSDARYYTGEILAPTGEETTR